MVLIHKYNKIAQEKEEDTQILLLSIPAIFMHAGKNL